MRRLNPFIVKGFCLNKTDGINTTKIKRTELLCSASRKTYRASHRGIHPGTLVHAYPGCQRVFLFCFAAIVSGEAAIVNERKKNPLVTAGMNLTSMLIRDKTVCQTGFMWDVFVFVI